MNTRKSISSLAGKLLLAMPSIGDKRFEKAVIFVCAHDQQGAMGLMINHVRSNISFNQVIAQAGIKSDITMDLDAVTVLDGGPVDASRGFMLHSRDYERKETVGVSSKYAVSGTLDALRDMVTGNAPQDMLFVMGHAGWAAGQLDQELVQNAWLVADARPDFVFGLPLEKRWEAALASIGIDPAMLSDTIGHA